jgi:hypothetical protein
MQGPQNFRTVIKCLTENTKNKCIEHGHDLTIYVKRSITLSYGAFTNQIRQ